MGGGNGYGTPCIYRKIVIIPVDICEKSVVLANNWSSKKTSEMVNFDYFFDLKEDLDSGNMGEWREKIKYGGYRERKKDIPQWLFIISKIVIIKKNNYMVSSKLTVILLQI